MKKEEKCPACGYCPHCGRSDGPAKMAPYPVPYPYPVVPQPYRPWQPTWYSQPNTITCGGASSVIAATTGRVMN